MFVVLPNYAEEADSTRISKVSLECWLLSVPTTPFPSLKEQCPVPPRQVEPKMNFCSHFKKNESGFHFTILSRSVAETDNVGRRNFRVRKGVKQMRAVLWLGWNKEMERMLRWVRWCNVIFITVKCPVTWLPCKEWQILGWKETTLWVLPGLCGDSCEH